jgi:hypothetical protein
VRLAAILSRAALVLLAAAAPARAQELAMDAGTLAHALDRLANTGRVLYVAAHPDDENTAMLAWLGNERLYRTGYLSVTRGDGGQNLIGDETGPLLGMIRTQELLAARRIDGAEQMFTRAIDFGYSKSPEETLAIWGHDPVLADVVWAIRRFQPDVVVTRFPVTGEGGHGRSRGAASAPSAPISRRLRCGRRSRRVARVWGTEGNGFSRHSFSATASGCRR